MSEPECDARDDGHSRTCPVRGRPLSDDDCTCGLKWHIQLRTEQEMHAAWRKRAEEAETREAALQARVEAQDVQLKTAREALEPMRNFTGMVTVKVVGDALECIVRALAALGEKEPPK